ncbi:MAG: hypothetical protein AUK03_13435 [Anaerolineae bacterium CG2_30_64_16]|nr:MAG: hypothetical protein AUK03_13435 [Anaerolineae bacterium CG2_30_64_16]
MYCDTHCHLDLPHFDPDRDQVIARAEAAGVRLIVNPSIHLDSAREVLALADRYPGVYAAVGVHPNDCADLDAGTLAELRKLAVHSKVVAIGEIGLDYYWEQVPHAQQRVALRAQLALAAELDLPVILHSRQSNADLLWELAQWGPEARKKRGEGAILGVWHAFSGDPSTSPSTNSGPGSGQALAEAEAAYELGFVIGLGGPVTFRNARRLRALAPQLRVDRLLLETDAPYLAPHPYRGQRNEPAYVPLVAETLATLCGSTVQAVAEQTTETARRCFGTMA